MDGQFLTNLLDQATGLVVAVVLLTRIEHKLDQLNEQLSAFLTKLDKPL